MYDECCGVAEKSGYPISVDVKDRALSIFRKRIKINCFNAERFGSQSKDEYEHILGSMVDYAKSVGAMHKSDSFLHANGYSRSRKKLKKSEEFDVLNLSSRWLVENSLVFSPTYQL